MRTPARLPLIYVAGAVWALGPSPLLSRWIAQSIIRFVLPQDRLTESPQVGCGACPLHTGGA